MPLLSARLTGASALKAAIIRHMKLSCLLPGAALALVIFSSGSFAQETGIWRAQSTTARGVTGDLQLTDTRIIVNFTGFTLAEIRDLQPAEAKAVFGETAPDGGTGHLYRTEIPAEKRFAHKNTLCGSEEVQWIVTDRSGRNLQVAMFSGSSMPQLTAEAVANTTTLCGTYSYVR